MGRNKGIEAELKLERKGTVKKKRMAYSEGGK